MNTERKENLIDRSKAMKITLDGKPATIGGRLLNFAIVGTVDGSQKYEWAWETVQKILNDGGKFTS